jgi:hypothetical protein
MKADIITEGSRLAGKAGEEFFKHYCQTNNIEFKESTKEEDYGLGIDCWADGIPTDVKNTEELFFLQIYIDSTSINVRHPFKPSSKALQYAVVKASSDDIKNGTLIEIVGIKERLIRDYVKDDLSYGKFIKTLFDMEGKKAKDYGVSIAQAAFKIKALLTGYLKPGAGITYAEITGESKEISFKLTKGKVKVVTQEQSKDISSILDKYRKKANDNITTNISQEEVIIKVEI